MTLDRLVDRERRYGRTLGTAMTVLAALAATAAIVAISAVLLGNGTWIGLPAVVPLICWAVALAGAAAAAWIVRRRSGTPTVAMVATAIERERSMRRGTVRGALEVGDRGDLGAAAAGQVERQLQSLRGAPLAPAWRASLNARLRTAVLVFLAASGAVVAGALVRPDGALVMAAPVSALTGGLLEPVTIDVPAIVARGSKVTAQVSAPRRARVEVRHRVTGGAWRSASHTVQDGRVELTIGPVDADLTLSVGDGRGAPVEAKVRVVDRPFLGDVAMRAVFPAYLDRAAESVPAGEPVELPRGTVLELNGRASVPLRRVALARGSDTVVLMPRDRAFRGRFVLDARADGRWEWLAEGEESIADLPLPLEIHVVPDSAPRVDIVSPGVDTVMATGERALLRGLATDDHGISAVTLNVRRAPAGVPVTADIVRRLDHGGDAQWSGDAQLDFAVLSLEPGDALHVRIEVVDDSPWAQRAVSRTVVIRIPTMTERRERARSAADSVVAGASAAARRQADLERRTAESARGRGERRTGDAPHAARNEPMTYERTEQAKALAQEQRALAEQVRELERQTRELEQRLKEAGALDSALAQQLRDVQRLLADALTRQMAEQLRGLEKALQDLSSDRARDALRDLAREQERLRQQLEHSAEMLRRAALEGAMQTLADEARDLENRQRQAADSLSRGRDTPEPAPRLGDEAQSLSREAQELAERLLKEQAETGASRARSAASDARRSAEAMRQAGRQDAPKDAAQSAREGAEAMRAAADALEKARSEQIEEWRTQLTETLDRSIQEMLQLANEQRQLEARARQGEQQTGLRGQQGAVQQGTERASDRVSDASKRSAHVGAGARRSVEEARRQVQEATRALNEQGSAPDRTADEMRDAADALTRAAASLVRDRERAASGQSASGFSEMMQALQQLAKQQGALSSQGMSLLPVPGQSNREGADMQAAAQGLARQQRGVAEKLEEIADAGGDGRAMELAREARQIARALESGAVDAPTIARQQQLFRRLLDAGRTMEKDEREDTGKREAQTAGEFQAHRPGASTPADAKRTITAPRWEDLRGLSPEERRAVLEYFRRLNAGTP